MFDGVTTNGTSQGLGVKISNSKTNATGWAASVYIIISQADMIHTYRQIQAMLNT